MKTLTITALWGAFMLLGNMNPALAQDGYEIAGRHTIRFTAPAQRVPTGGMVDGPLMGNGDVGVVLAGPPEQLQFYIGKSDLWGVRSLGAKTVGRVELLMPQLKGASYQVDEDMQRGEVRGVFSKQDQQVGTRSWVDANRNILFTELTNDGNHPLTFQIDCYKGPIATYPRVSDSSSPVYVGGSPYGPGNPGSPAITNRYFRGELADMKVLTEALSGEKIAELAQNKPTNIESFDGSLHQELKVPTASTCFSITAWVKTGELPKTDYTCLVTKGRWGYTYALGLSRGRLHIESSGVFIDTDEPLPAGQWVHVAGVYDGKTLALYVNGELKKFLSPQMPEPGSEFLRELDPGDARGRKVALATGILGGGDTKAYMLKPGEKTIIATAILSDRDAKDPMAEARAQLAPLDEAKVASYSAAHRRWWKEFWSRSFVEVPDKVIEQHWYSSLYILGSGCRPGKVAPGLWGIWITTDRSNWGSDYHLNYNFQAPFYGVFAANHTDLALPFLDATNQMIPRGRELAAKYGFKGIDLPCNTLPLGTGGIGGDYGQRSNAAFSALLYIWYYQYTRDTTWLREQGYSYLQLVAEFWEDYLKFEDGRYMIYKDGIFEGNAPDVNGLLSLGLLRTFFKSMIVMSADLGVDADRRAKWQDICEKLSAFSTMERNGKTVFRLTEKGVDWADRNVLGISHIFPAGAIGPDSDPQLLEISRNMIDAMGKWVDANGMCAWYTACVRVGYDPKVILRQLRALYDRYSLPNKIISFYGGGIENVSPFLAVTEMLLTSSDGTLRLFSCWPRELDARFGQLRTVGAFVVSAELKAGVIGPITVVSEKGSPCKIVNPWPGREVQVVRDGKPAERLSGERLLVNTSVGETLVLRPVP